ncbi:tripartite tricarboxylate transporter substrate binding protein [Sporomusa acidovorans]|uniref:Tripartite tricarboxylate transporter family receptor n=1 Tax=Sporomusa acidovorans (strain ATCC 49682 / DSM 3132 / Mol) TaxID=1123286 RepID=A0ABZ3J9E7_SPOA4|nr:tripartite tricarboxylate transporter substrate binding protein [Sporomusa acidovorans]OZC17495.1 tripartite tricarboxylate transporter family receptor [Sporomusa acidovorans DSM 3132]SDF07460.1 Tripartite-type tricarboxylate transporter, receptor component TctC [Sporomusa acidovorans]
MGAKESVVSEKYPAKPITIIVPFAAGGGMDIIARSLEKSSIKHLGQPVIVVNMPGGSGTIGMNELAGSKLDGYTIGAVSSGLILQPLYGQTRYHYPTALDPLVKVVDTPVIVATLADKPWGNLSELVSYAKEHPGEIKFSHSGLGTMEHIVGETFAKETSLDIKQVPFKGSSESLAALLGGHVQLIFAASPAVLKEHIKNGTIKVLGVADEKRLTIPGFENIPTFKEQGINVAFSFWNGIAAPKGLPPAEKEKLAAGLKAMIDDPEFKKNMEEMGISVGYMGPEEFGAEWIKDNEELTKIVKETGIAELIAAQKK